MMQGELWKMGIAELAAAIRKKQVSSREVVQAHLERIEALNSKLNAIVVLLAEQALSWLKAVRLIVMVNMLGLPSVALPTGVSDGLPQAVQIIGPRYREDLCLDAAEAVEERLGTVTPIDPR
jgi:Asp-tRNA(Asn)/Glu-tRNA(Gln) amidotransferase A subunit family amidase